MNILITICGRAGSKGVANKNFKKFLGRPLIDYTIDLASKFKTKYNTIHLIDICVNSDSQKLLEIAGENREDIFKIERPIELAQDTSPKIPVIIHSVNYMERIQNIKYNYVIDLDITSPMRKLEDIEKSLEKMLEEKNLDVVFSVVSARRNPYFNMIEVLNDKVKKVKDSNYIRRQEAPPVYEMNASIYCYNRISLGSIIKTSPFNGNCGFFVMKDYGVLDIDNEEDFQLMEIIANAYKFF